MLQANSISQVITVTIKNRQQKVDPFLMIIQRKHTLYTHSRYSATSNCLKIGMVRWDIFSLIRLLVNVFIYSTSSQGLREIVKVNAIEISVFGCKNSNLRHMVEATSSI